MLRPSKRSHEIFYANKAHQEAQENMLVLTRQAPQKKKLIIDNIERIKANLEPDKIEIIRSEALAIVQKELEQQTTFVIQAMTDLADAENTADSYLCCQCNKEFGNEEHIDILLVSLLEFDENGIAQSNRIDFGMSDVINNKMGRRIKICNDCITKWKIHPKDYINLR